LLIPLAVKDGILTNRAFGDITILVLVMFTFADRDNRESESAPQTHFRHEIALAMTRFMIAVVTGECHNERKLVVRAEKELCQAADEMLTDDYFPSVDKLKNAKFWLHSGIGIIVEVIVFRLSEDQAPGTEHKRMALAIAYKICSEAVYLAFQ
jgi:hypothetical protein